MADRQLLYDQVLLNSKVAGKLKLSAAGFGWKANEGAKVFTHDIGDLKKFTVKPAARGMQLQVDLANGQSVRLDGLPRDCADDVRRFVQQVYNAEFELVEPAVKGWSWGSVEVRSNALQFLVGRAEAFSIPLGEVSNVMPGSKNEVIFEFSTANQPKDEMVVDIRLFVPNTVQASEDEAANTTTDETSKEGEDAEGGDDKPDAKAAPLTSAEILHHSVRDLIDVGQSAGEQIASFPEVPCVYPRGRYTVEFFRSFWRLHGKTHAHKIKYESVASIMLLPRKEDRSQILLVSLSSPLRAGATAYHHLVMHIGNDVDGACTVNLPDDEIAKHGDKLQKEYTSDYSLASVLGDLLRALARKPLETIGAYRSEQNTSSVKCALGTSLGALFPLEKHLVFVPKPPTIIRLADIANVEFSRMSSGSSVRAGRSFDMTVTMHSGTEFVFGQIIREEHAALAKYCTDKRIPIVAGAAMSSGRDDEDDEGSGSEAEEGEGRRRRKAADVGAMELDEDDEGSEEDNDFNPNGDSDGGSPSESEDDSDGDAVEVDEDAEESRGGSKKRNKGGDGGGDKASPKKKAAKKDGGDKPKAKAALKAPAPRKGADTGKLMADEIDDEDMD